MTNLGTMNAWGKKAPEEYRDCQDKKHKLQSENKGKCLTREWCAICKIEWTVDSGG
jgi:hypothetical protein